MKAYDGPAVLRWRANWTFALDCDVAAVVIASARGWDVSVVPSTQDDRWGLNTFPNPWELVFPDGSAFDVDVAANGNAWTVTEVAGA
ncbi:hypothetical protein ACTMTF_27985 [Nonomuraea sp. ZG12]|uniref:hypothetical protein n=1 Tax=Nonomuraea sp. ZG12 TaxID=3452207 RepID=UPI003F8A9104